MKTLLTIAVCLLSFLGSVTANGQSDKDYSSHQGKANYSVLKDKPTMDHTRHDARVKADAVCKEVEKKAKEAEEKAKNEAAKEEREKIRKEQEQKAEAQKAEAQK